MPSAIFLINMELMSLRILRTPVFFSVLLFAETLFAQGSQGNGANQGARQFAVTCAGCHGLDGSGSAKGAAITVPRVIALSDSDLVRIVRDGVPGKGMPASQLGDQEIQSIVQYLRTIQRAAASSPDVTIAVKSPANANPAQPTATTGPQPQTAKTEVPAKPAPVGTGFIDVRQSDLNQKEVKENWVSYNGDYTGRRYSAMDEVTPANVARLKTKWVFHTTGAGIMEVTPVVVAGVMFITRSNDAWALDAKTGKQLWHHERAVSSGLIDDASGHINRGVAVLGTRVYMETDNAHLLCLDARSGSQIWDVAYATGNKNYGATSAPLIVKDKVLVGTSGGDDGVRGFVAAFDAQTGKEAWRFWTIPAPGEKGSESWPGDLYLHGGGTTWMPGTYDPELNTIYWGTSNPSPDFDGSVRPGDDLYTSSLLALDPDTGKLKWHFQFNPHDMYDYDGVQTPVLVDATFKGQPRKLVVTANRNGFLYILDRTDGKYLFSKQFSPSQNWAKSIDENGRPVSNNLVPNEQGVTVCPGYSGGTNWYSPTYNPATSTFYFRSLEACSLFMAKTESFKEGEEYYSTGVERPKGDTPNAGYLNAFDLNTLDFVWRNQLTGDGQAIAGAIRPPEGSWPSAMTPQTSRSTMRTPENDCGPSRSDRRCMRRPCRMASRAGSTLPWQPETMSLPLHCRRDEQQQRDQPDVVTSSR
jgi:alcohol dehydrogenase (cytochrome c)